MRNRLLLSGAAWLACLAPSASQTYHDSAGTVSPAVVPLINCTTATNCVGPVSPSNPLPVSGTFSASLSGFAPGSAYATPLAVSTSSSRVALPSGTVVVVYNTGANAAFVTLGGASVVASTAADVIQPNSWMAFTTGLNGYLAAVTASGSAALNLSGGSGLPTGAGGGGGGGGSLPTGSAGSPNASVVSVQGVSGGSPEPVSLSAMPPLASGSNTIGNIGNTSFGISGALPAFASTPTVNIGTLNGAATAAAQTAVETAPGSSATTAVTVQGSALGVPMPVTGTLSASVGGFAPGGAYGSPLSVSTTSVSEALPTGTTVIVYNTGANAAYVRLGASGVAATTANDVVPAGGWLALTVGTNTTLAAITAIGSTSLNLSGGAGLATGVSGGGGGGGGSVAVSSLPALSAGASTIGSIGNTSFGISGALPAFASTPSVNAVESGAWNVGLNAGSNAIGSVTVSNLPVTQPVSASALPLPSGAATSAAQTSVESAPGTPQTAAVTVQGNTSGVPLPVSVSGTLTATYYDSGAVRASASPGAPAHAAGQSVGGLVTIPIARTNGGSGIVTSLFAWSSWGSTGTYVVRVWQKNPTGTTCTDNSAFASSATDDAYLIGGGPTTVTFGTPATTIGDAKTYASLTGITWDYKNVDASATQNLYVCLVNASADTPGATATISISLSGPVN